MFIPGGIFMFGKKFFGTVALGSAAVGLVGNSGQIFAKDFGISDEEKIAALQNFVDWLDVSKSDFEQLCVKAEAALHMAEQAMKRENFFYPLDEKILAVFKDGSFGGDFYFYNKIPFNQYDYWHVSLEELRYYLRELKYNPSLLESIRFKK